jgi:hypothetical protein
MILCMSAHTQTPHESDEQWRQDVSAFARAMWKHWRWWVGQILGSAIGTIYKSAGGQIPSWLLWLVGLSGVVLAAFRTYCDQRRIEESAKKDVTEIKQQLADATKQPKPLEIKPLPIKYDLYTNTIVLESDSNFKTHSTSATSAECQIEFIKGTFGETEAGSFATDSGFPDVPVKSVYGRWNNIIHHLKQYEFRLTELIKRNT